MGGIFSFAKRNEPPVIRDIKLAVCFGYLGTAFGDAGANKSAGVEKVVLDAMIEAGLVPREMVSNLGWKIGVRTEKKAHAAAQVASLKLRSDGLRCSADALNRCLVDTATVRFWSVLEVEPWFDAQRLCEIQSFVYLLPLSVIGSSFVESLRNVALPMFAGEHDFHNFVDEFPTTRVIYGVRLGDVVAKDGVEFLPFHFRGKAFAKGQIRRIMTVLILFALQVMTVDQLMATLGTQKWNIPKAPAVCLVLDSVGYPYYMRRMRKPDPNRADVEFRGVRPEIELWKYDVVLQEIVDVLKATSEFERWVRKDRHRLGAPDGQ